ncbi:MAG TPA: hypothetical protein PLM07_21900, partial [Candidatus Rifleibacterium sp.]|nr:hypothetical protein [Candidatus Rifleibacterium sp.]
MTKNDPLKELAGDFLARFSPAVLKQVDGLFDQLKSDSPSKLAVNFGLAMPPEMRRRVLAAIGLEDAAAPQIASRHLPYLIVMKNLVEKFGDSLVNASKEEIAAHIWTDVTDDWARLMEVDDNLAGAEMNALDTAVFLAERKKVYEKLHPETKA